MPVQHMMHSRGCLMCLSVSWMRPSESTKRCSRAFKLSHAVTVTFAPDSDSESESEPSAVTGGGPGSFLGTSVRRVQRHSHTAALLPGLVCIPGPLGPQSLVSTGRLGVGVQRKPPTRPGLGGDSGESDGHGVRVPGISGMLNYQMKLQRTGSQRTVTGSGEFGPCGSCRS